MILAECQDVMALVFDCDEQNGKVGYLGGRV